uniref:WAP domain-containing protein n=1 Tax=Fundulus heteroclitus TaxID=8078 RepID=A0A3Q2QRB9_FUNHE
MDAETNIIKQDILIIFFLLFQFIRIVFLAIHRAVKAMQNVSFLSKHDGCCPGQEKCCVFFGGSVCAPPILTQPGCPDIKGKVGVCAELCSCDSDCRHGEKCCSNGCEILDKEKNSPSYTCDKPGGCGPPWFSFLCGHPCHHDSDCPGQKKCCPTLCSFTCQEPHQPHCS